MGWDYAELMALRRRHEDIWQRLKEGHAWHGFVLREQDLSAVRAQELER